MKAAAAVHPGKRIALWFMDEARVGQKGRLCHRWWSRGRRPPGRCDGRFGWVYLFAAVEPATGRNVALVLPEATTTTMNLFLAEFAADCPILLAGPDEAAPPVRTTLAELLPRAFRPSDLLG